MSAKSSPLPPYPLRTVARITAMLIALACGDSTAPRPVPVKYAVSSSAPSAIVGNSLEIRAQLVDADDKPVAISGRTVTWSSRAVIPGIGLRAAGSFSAPTSTTNADGIATVTLTLGTVADALYQVTALDAQLPGVVGFTYVLSSAGPVAKYILSTSVIDPPAGADIVIYAQAADGYDNPTRTQGRLVTWSNTGSGGSFAQPATGTDVNGTAAVTFTTSTVAGTTHTISAKDPDGLMGTSHDITTQSQVSLASIAIGVGAISSCGIAFDGAAWCWGANDIGGLGNGTTVDRSLPGKVSGNLTMTSLTAGYLYACGVTTSGGVQCWGSNSNGQLGDNTTTSHSVPAPIASSLTFTSVAASSPLLAGSAHTCALATSGDAYCWGSNANGQLGEGSQTRATQPVKVAGGFLFASISAGGSHTCGVTTGGDAYCWGANGNGQLGDNSLADRTTPGAVAGGFKFTSVSAGGSRTCGIVVGGAAYCWGTDSTQHTIPTPVTGGLSFAAISVSGLHACGITTTSTAWCWGFNDTGALGKGDRNGSASPMAVAGGLLFKSIGAGGAIIQYDNFPHYHMYSHTCGVTTAGVAYCWGSNARGELGYGPTIGLSSTPLKVGGQP